jgi:hypothetical protein
VSRSFVPLMVAVMVAAGCTTHHASPAAPASPVTADPLMVSRAVLNLLWTLDTATDGEDDFQHAGEMRAAVSPYVTDAYAVQLRGALATGLPGDTWQQWARHRAYLDVRLTPGTEAIPPDTDTTAYRQWVLVTRPTGRDGWQGDPVTHIADVILARGAPGTAWQVDAIQYSD